MLKQPLTEFKSRPTKAFQPADHVIERFVRHCARAQLDVTQGIRVSINVVANGYHLQFGDMNNATELFLGTNCIWRVCQGLLRNTDFISPVESN